MTGRGNNATLLALVLPAMVLLGFATVRTMLSFQLALMAFLASVVVALPVLVRRSGSLVEPITIASVLVFFGVSLRLLVVSAAGPDNELVASKLLNGEDPEVLFRGAMAVLIGLMAMSAGYLANPAPFRLDRTFLIRRSDWSIQRTRLAVLGITVVGSIGLVQLVRTFGLSPISAKRFNDLDGGAQARSGTLEFVYFRMALLLRFGLYILVMFRRRVSARFRLLVPFLFVVSAFVPFYVNNRAGVALIVVDLLVIAYCSAGRFKVSQLAGAAGFVSFSALGILSFRGSRNSVVESTVFSRDLLDVSKTAQIVQLEPGVLDGKTLYGWVPAQLPIESDAGSAWVNLGRYVWTNAYGQPGQNGIPAGLVGEMYLNGGWVAVVLGLFFFGYLLRKIFVSFRSYLDLLGPGLLYALIVPRLTIFGLSNDLGTGVLKVVADVIPIVCFLWFVGVREDMSQRDAGTASFAVSGGQRPMS